MSVSLESMNKILAVLAAITLASITSPVKADEVMDYTDYNKPSWENGFGELDSGMLVTWQVVEADELISLAFIIPGKAITSANGITLAEVGHVNCKVGRFNLFVFSEDKSPKSKQADLQQTALEVAKEFCGTYKNMFGSSPYFQQKIFLQYVKNEIPRRLVMDND